MGADMVTMVLPLPHGRALDWDAAARAVRDVRLEVLLVEKRHVRGSSGASDYPRQGYQTTGTS